MFGEVWSHKRLFTGDQIVVAASLTLAFILQSGFPAVWSDGARLAELILAGMVTAGVVFPLSGMYRRHWFSASIRDVLIVGSAAALMLTLVALLNLFGLAAAGTPAGVYIVALFVAPPFLALERLARRINNNAVGLLLGGGKAQPKRGADSVLLVGTGTACDLFLRAIRNMPNPPFEPIGIVDDVEHTRGLVFQDVPIIGSVVDMDTVREFFVTHPLPRHIVITEPPAQFNESNIRDLLTWAEARGIGVRRLPGLFELHSFDETTATRTVEVHPNDLLHRPARVNDRRRLARRLTGRRIVVTGAGGSIGGELVRQIAANEPESLLLIDNSEFNLYSINKDLERFFPGVERQVQICDVRDRARVEYLFETYRPDIVFHAAALKHVPMVEANPREGVLTNVTGTRNVADAARNSGASAMVQISTDKAVNGTSVMGATKRVAELYCGALDRETERDAHGTRFMTVRFGNVLGSSGSLIPLFKEQIAKGGPLTVTDPRMERYFMTIREAVELTLMASAHGLEQKTERGAIFVLDMGEPVRIVDIAERMIRLSGLEPGRDIGIEYIGMRPGEKLYEELFDALETPRPSGLDGALLAASAVVPLDALRASTDRLEAFAGMNDVPMILDMLHKIVPGYGDGATTARPPAPSRQVLVQANGQKSVKRPDRIAPRPEADKPRFPTAPRFPGSPLAAGGDLRKS